MEQTYKIGEAAALLNLKTYVLRFWETEFPQIAPLRTEKGQRLYTAKDIELLERIRYLLHEQGLTIDGARKILESNDPESFSPLPDGEGVFVFSSPSASTSPSAPSPTGLNDKALKILIHDLEEVAALLRGDVHKGNFLQ